VDDMLIAARNKVHIQKLKAQLKKEFDMKDLGETKKILGMKITRDRGSDRLWLSQKNYVLKVLERFNMAEVKPVTTPLAGHFKYPPSNVHNHRKRRRCLEYYMLVRWDHSCMLIPYAMSRVSYASWTRARTS